MYAFYMHQQARENDFHPGPRSMAPSVVRSAMAQEGPLGQPSTCSQKPEGPMSSVAIAKESGRRSRLRGLRFRSTMNSNGAKLV